MRGVRGIGSTKRELQGVDECDVRPLNDDQNNPCCKIVPCSICLEFIDDTGVTHYGDAALFTPDELYDIDREIFWHGEVGDQIIRLSVIPDFDAPGRCNLIIQDYAVDYAPIIFQVSQCTSESVCIPAGSIPYLGGTLTWRIKGIIRNNVIFSGDGDCTAHCKDCRCICSEICFRWEKVIDPLALVCHCGPISERIDFNCDEQGWDLIFEPSCPNVYGEQDIHYFEMVLEEYTGDQCDWVVYLDGIERIRETANAESCIRPTLGAQFVDDNGDTISISVDCSECGRCSEEVCTVGCCFKNSGNGNPKSMEYSIFAPNCADLDGITGSVPPLEWYPTACGFCACMDVQAPVESFGITGQTCINGFTTPCSIALKFTLGCHVNVDAGDLNPTSLDPCCSKLILLVEVIGAGHENTPRGILGLECDDFIMASSFITPTDCGCDCDTGLTAEFALGGANMDCTAPAYGGCYDAPDNCCEVTACDLVDATISFSTPA